MSVQTHLMDALTMDRKSFIQSTGECLFTIITSTFQCACGYRTRSAGSFHDHTRACKLITEVSNYAEQD